MQQLKHLLPRLSAHKVSQDLAVVATEGLVGGHSEGGIARGDDPAAHHGNGQLHAAFGSVEAGQGVDEQVGQLLGAKLRSRSAVVVDDVRESRENSCTGTSSDVGFASVVAIGPADVQGVS